MNIYEDDFLRALELEDNLPGTTRAQIEANEHRRNLYLHFVNKKPNDVELAYTTLSEQMHMNRILDPSYRFSSAGMLI